MKNVSIKFTQDDANPRRISIFVTGDLTIDNIKNFKELMLQKIDDADEFDFKIDDIDTIDLAFYQFMIALKKTLENQNKTMTVNISLSDEKEDLFLKSGLDINFN